MDNNIKNYREKELRNYVIANILIILYCTKKLAFLQIMGSMTANSFLGLLINSGIIGSFIYCYVFIIDSVIPSEWKDYIIYFGKNKRPGNTIFSDIENGKVKDDRFSKDDAKSFYSNIYCQVDDNQRTDQENRKFENKEWYKIYLKYQNETKILVLNRDYLLCRDIAMMSVSLMIVYFILAFLFTLTINIRLVIFLGFEFVICREAAKSKAQRMANTVIAEDLGKNNKSEAGK